MGTPKRKRQVTDSAIAGMSSQDSLTTASGIQSSASSTLSTQPYEAPNSPVKRRKSSFAQLGFDVGDFETAASQRPRRRTVSQSSPQASMLLDSEQSDDTPDQKICSVPGIGNESQSRTSAQKVKGHIERNSTPEPEQAPTFLPTPPQTVKKGSIRAVPQSPLRKSTRDRRPPERFQQAQTKDSSPSKKSPQTARLCGKPKVQEPETCDQKSCIVRLKLTSSVPPEPDSSMPFTDSISLQQKSADSQNPHASQVQDPEFAGTNSFQEPETFAQPRSDPILADTPSFYSSQTDADVETQAIVVHAPDGFSSERTGTSDWISRHEAVQDDAIANDDSWRTEPTQPCLPRGTAASPIAGRQESVLVSTLASQATTVEEASSQMPLRQYALKKEDLHKITHQLCAHRTSRPKPEPLDKPAVWAEKRMDLCETLHYFRSYHSSCHSTGGFVRGFMFDKVAGARDYLDSNVVIARASGGQAKDKESGEMRATKDQVEGTVSQNLRNCMNHYNPVVIITGVDNPHMPSQPPHQYCVLDYFKPTHIWSEMSEGKQIVRYRFEKLNVEKQSWWRAKNSEEPIGLGDLEPPVSKPCGTCARESPQIYLNGWMCLHPTCGSFWQIFPSGPRSSQGNEPYEPDETALVYDPRFLKSHTPWPNDNHIYPLTSTDATTSPHAIPGEDTSEAFTRGVVCQLCGRCVARLSWTGWACPCGWKKSPRHTLIPALSTREPFWPLSEAYTTSRDTHSQLIDVKVSFAHGYRINQYVLPGINGFFTHMIANASVVQTPGGPDDMFEALQREDIGLKRRPMESSMLKGGLYTRHFCVNYGMPYKFVAATETHAFPANSQHPINAARDLLNWAQGHLLSRPPASDSTEPVLEDLNSIDPTSSQPKPAPSVTPFNELLALGYFASQRISYHDDGESGLGPTIATLSLGAPGIMRLRLKAKHDTGVSKSGIYNDTPPVPGSQSYGSRLALMPKLAELKKSVSPSVYRERLREVPKELGLGLWKGGKETKGGLGREALKLVLGHGDVVVMHGEALQRYYEHAVEHEGALRFALTCRWIDPLSVAEGESDSSGVETEGACEKEGVPDE